MRSRGWRLACTEAARDVGFLPGLGLGLQPAGSATLANAIAARVRRALRSGSAPLVCSACRAAGALTCCLAADCVSLHVQAWPICRPA